MDGQNLIKPTIEELLECVKFISQLVYDDLKNLSNVESIIQCFGYKSYPTKGPFHRINIVHGCCYYLSQMARLHEQSHDSQGHLKFSLEHLRIWQMECEARIAIQPQLEHIYSIITKEIHNILRHQLYSVVRINNLQYRLDNQLWWCIDKYITSIILHIAVKGDQRLRDAARAHFLEIRRVAPLIYQELILSIYKLEWLPDNIEDVLGVSCDLLVQLGIIP